MDSQAWCVGHLAQKKYFHKVMMDQTLAHAYCFEGLKGIGKETFARHMSRYLLCGDDPSKLKRFDSNNHPDYMLLKPDGNSIKTQQIEEVHEFIHLKPYVADLKILVIDDAPKMTEQAQNKLLKLIEEPPGHALIILLTDNYHKLLQTIQSRVIRVGFNPLNQETLLELCQLKGLAIDEGLFVFSQGSFAKYLHMTEDPVFQSAIQQVLLLCRSLVLGDVVQVIKASKVFEMAKDETEAMIDMMSIWFQDVLMIQFHADEALLRVPQDHQSMVQCSMRLSSDKIVHIQEALHKAKHTLSRQQNHTLVIEVMMQRIQEAING